ncbi:MAG: lysophospholipid acyltransferase family protein [Robiginitomaculum sp.]|nr:lysophospholipid acyltransferase family protein [Robiginitomaculum sp.]MDQ7077013.1 lysophospholipid acyltransferase family protein [Robiginitomaculum sp.]
MLKRLFRSSLLHVTLATLLAGYMRLIKASTRWTVQGQEVMKPLWQEGKGMIGALWHGRVAMAIAAWPMERQQPAFLISRSPDGAFIARAADALGAKIIRGSAKNLRKSKEKGGSTAFRQMIRHVEEGGCMAITPDGPRGPVMHASMGAIKLASLTGAPILCLGMATRWRLGLSTWDRFMLPLPLGRGAIVWKGPVWVPKDADDAMLEEKRRELETLLCAATDEADLACGHAPIEATP